MSNWGRFFLTHFLHSKMSQIEVYPKRPRLLKMSRKETSPITHWRFIMRNRRKVLAIILSMLMAVQTPAMASELVVEEVSVPEEIAPEEYLPEEEAAEEVSEEITEAVPEEPFQGGELVEELAEDNILPEDPFEEELVEEPVGTITEEEPAEAIDIALSGQEELLEGNDPLLVGSTSGQCGDNVYWTLSKDGVLNITGSGSMWDANWDNDTQTAAAPWLPSSKEIYILALYFVKKCDDREQCELHRY